MKKYLVSLLVVVAITFVGVSVSRASEQAFSPATSDTMTVLSRFDLDGISHAVITFNNSDQTAFVALLDADGFTDPGFFGYGFLFADFFTGTLYGSNDGSNWSIIGSL